MRERFGRLGVELRSRARDQARWLIRDHGDDAEAVLSGKMRRPTNSRADRYRFRCTARELHRLRVIEAEGRRHANALMAGTPPLSALADWLARLVDRGSRRGSDH